MTSGSRTDVLRWSRGAARPGLSGLLLVLLGNGCGGAVRPPAPPARADDNVASRDAIHVKLYPREHERWSLRRADDSYVCTLPCSYWIKPQDTFHLQLEGPGSWVAPETSSYTLPQPLPAGPGEEVTVTVDRMHGLGTVGKFIAAPTAVITGLMGGIVTALSIGSLATGSKHVTSTASGCASVDVHGQEGNSSVDLNASGCATTTHKGVAADIGGLALGVGLLGLSALSIYWFRHSGDGGLRYEEAGSSPAVTLRFAPGAIGIETRTTRTWLTPLGIHGSF